MKLWRDTFYNNFKTCNIYDVLEANIHFLFTSDEVQHFYNYSYEPGDIPLFPRGTHNNTTAQLMKHFSEPHIRT